MRVPIAYFAGAGTVIAAIGLGLGGGLTIANVMSPHQEKVEQTRLEQRMSAKPIAPAVDADQSKTQASNAQADQPKGPVPYVAATQAVASAPAAVTAPAQNQNQPQTQVAAPAPQPAEAKFANDQPAEPQARSQAAPREQVASSPEDANAKARDSDLKRLAAEKRKADRRQQWADRKKAQQQRDAELRAAEASVPGDADAPTVVRRDTDRIRVRDSDGPRIVVRQDDDGFNRRDDSDRRRGPDRPFGLPLFNLFGGGDRDD